MTRVEPSLCHDLKGVGVEKLGLGEGAWWQAIWVDVPPTMWAIHRSYVAGTEQHTGGEQQQTHLRGLLQRLLTRCS